MRCSTAFSWANLVCRSCAGFIDRASSVVCKSEWTAYSLTNKLNAACVEYHCRSLSLRAAQRDFQILPVAVGDDIRCCLMHAVSGRWKCVDVNDAHVLTPIRLKGAEAEDEDPVVGALLIQ